MFQLNPRCCEILRTIPKFDHDISNLTLWIRSTYFNNSIFNCVDFWIIVLWNYYHSICSLKLCLLNLNTLTYAWGNNYIPCFSSG